MAITSIGFDGSVDESAWTKLAAYLGRPPCVAPLGAWKVTAVVGPDRTVRVAAGVGYGGGVLDTSTTTVDVQLATIASGTRWDAVVARRDWTPTPGGGTTFTSVAGTSTQALPAGLLSNDGVTSDQVLALVQLTAGQSTPTAVIDMRGIPTKGVSYPSAFAVPIYADTGATVDVAGHTFVKSLATGWVPQFEGAVHSPGALAATFTASGGTSAVSGGFTPAAVAFPRVLRVSFSGMVASIVTGQPVDFILRKNGAGIKYARVLTANTSVSGSYCEVIAAGASDTYQLFATSANAATISGDSRYVYLTATVTS